MITDTTILGEIDWRAAGDGLIMNILTIWYIYVYVTLVVPLPNKLVSVIT